MYASTKARGVLCYVPTAVQTNHCAVKWCGDSAYARRVGGGDGVGRRGCAPWPHSTRGAPVRCAGISFHNALHHRATYRPASYPWTLSQNKWRHLSKNIKSTMKYLLQYLRYVRNFMNLLWRTICMKIIGATIDLFDNLRKYAVIVWRDLDAGYPSLIFGLDLWVFTI